jgi:hypothetical protein
MYLVYIFAVDRVLLVSAFVPTYSYFLPDGRVSFHWSFVNRELDKVGWDHKDEEENTVYERGRRYHRAVRAGAPRIQVRYSHMTVR